MVKTKKVLNKAAFTLMELIFAIIIISIAIVSLPLMIQINADGVEKSIVQEAIFAASAELMGATSYYWDARSIEESAISHLSRVIDVGGDCNPITRQRVGHVGRRCLDSSVAAGVNYYSANATLGLNSTVHTAQNMFDNSAAQAAGYKQQYQSIMEINIATFTDIAALNNDVKELTLSVIDPNDATKNLTSLRIYCANIGEVEYYKRRF